VGQIERKTETGNCCNCGQSVASCKGQNENYRAKQRYQVSYELRRISTAHYAASLACYARSGPVRQVAHGRALTSSGFAKHKNPIVQIGPCRPFLCAAWADDSESLQYN